jgi:sucrose-6-phosphate hydrolase SacC (GH32 family)
MAADLPPLRPRLHFTPPRHWINDPNALLRMKGEWRLLFQYAADAPDYRRVGWGSAVSADLYDWRFEGVALEPLADRDAYSGSVISSPGEPDCLLALHTANRRLDAQRRLQTQELAISRDGGRRFERREDFGSIDIGSSDFRDPFVFRFGGEFRMLVAEPGSWDPARRSESARVQVYRGTDLACWSPCGIIDPGCARDELLEVPWMLSLPVSGQPGDPWLMAASLIDRSGGGTRCSTRWWIGDFDGMRFLPHDSGTLDHGPDYYAPIPSWDGNAHQALTIGWLGNWTYARRLPFGDWAGGPLSLPRRLEVRREGAGWHVVQRMAPGLAEARSNGVSERALSLIPACESTLELPPSPWLLELELHAQGAGRIALELREAGAGFVLDLERGKWTLARAASPLVASADWPGAWTAQRRTSASTITLRVFFDACCLEIETDGGERCFAMIVLPHSAPRTIAFRAEGGAAQVSARFVALR